MRCPNRVYNPLMWNQLGTGFRTDIKKGYTKCILFKFHGVMGHGSADTSKIGLMNSIIGFDQYITARVVPMRSSDNEHNHVVTHDDLTSVTLEGPSEHVQTNEGS